MAENSESSLLAFILGGMIGATLGILFAPRPGKETRSAVLKLVDELQEKGINTAMKARKIYEDGKEIVNEEKEKLTSVLEAGKKAYNKEKK
ncbi:MAG: YtxH domain-containing protein [Elusimicrobiota bacterium]